MIAAGTTVYRAYIACQVEGSWVDKGVVTDTVSDGVPLVRYGHILVPLDERWHTVKHGAERDIHAALIRHIGTLQAKADEMAATILHADLMTEAA